MPVIYVRAKPGRVARVSPKGELIPTDEFVPTRPSPWLDRLANHHGDIEISRTDPNASAGKKKDQAAPAVEVK